MRNLKILLSSAAAAAVPLSAAALWWLSSTGTTLALHVVISVILAVTLSLLLAAGLMGLVFLSNASGHDEAAADEAAKHDPDRWLDE